MITAIAFLLVQMLATSTAIAQEAPSTPADAQSGSATPDLADHVSKSFQFYPAEGSWGDYFDLTIEAGTSSTTTALLANTGEVAHELRTYAVDAFTANGGGFAAASYGTPPNEVTSWLDFPDQVFTIDVDTGIEITFTVSVPEATEPGQYITAIAAGNSEAGEVSGTENLTQITRFLVPVFITVPGPTTTEFEIGDASLSNVSDSLIISVPLRNTGDIRVRPKGTVELLDQEGKLVSSFPVEMQSIYAHDDTVLTVGVPGSIEPGVYEVRVNLTDPDSKVEASSTATNLEFQGSGALAERSLITITSASMLPAPAADNVQFANVEAVISNIGPPVANAQLSLIASVDGEEVERFPISQSLSLPSGDTPVTTRYIPATGWTTGEWSFELLLETVEPNGAAVVVGRQPIEGTITIP
jgi:hypothetical protein